MDTLTYSALDQQWADRTQFSWYQKRENSIFDIDFLTFKKHPISNLQPEFNIQVTSCNFCRVFYCNWRFRVFHFDSIHPSSWASNHTVLRGLVQKDNIQFGPNAKLSLVACPLRLTLPCRAICPPPPFPPWCRWTFEFVNCSTHFV